MDQLSMLNIIEKYNLVIPEIQREYVWGLDRDEILVEFLSDIRENIKVAREYEALQMEEIDRRSKEIINREGVKGLSEIQKLQDDLKSEKAMDIGFLYSYRPNYAVKGEVDDAYLIDGQQRFTTLFLIWFYLSVKQNKLDDFKEKARYEIKESKTGFDFRVRNITQDFFKELISRTKTVDDILTLSKKTWFLSDYKTDVSIKAIVNAFKLIHSECEDMEEFEYNYIINQIKFWHFNTNATSQGEELYITMNARGISISDNESVRAKLFEQMKDKSENRSKVTYWGTQWEEWQDLFWKNKGGKNENADVGFDSFLACTAGLERLINKRREFVDQDTYNERGNTPRNIYESIGLNEIKKYYDGFQFLTDPVNVENFRNQYEYSKWIEDCFDDIWEIINSNTNWFADYGDSGRGVEQSRMVFLWSLLYYLKQIEVENIDIDNLYRVLRIYYLRFKNYNRGVVQLLSDIDAIIEEGLWEFESIVDEENKKHNALIKTTEDEIRIIESLIWEIEDHEYNLNGRDLGAKNSSHLIDYSEPLDESSLTLIKEKFNTVTKDSNHKYLQSLLLMYGSYYDRVSPYYYYNYRFNNWRKIIRNETFKQFFSEFLLLDFSVEDMYREKRKKLVVSSDTEDLWGQLLWYFKHIGNNMWKEGNYIAIANSDYSCALHRYNGYERDKVFNNTNVIFNIHRSLQGGNPTPLFSLLDDEVKKLYINKDIKIEINN